jgi:mono/diheme cytochrome c family protein
LRDELEVKTSSHLNAVTAAMLTASIALSSAFAAAHVLQGEAARTSHQQARAENLFEPSTPTSPSLVATGRKLFLGNCAHCHGADARGDEGPDLHDVAVSDRYIAHIIVRGIPHEMPSFAKKFHPDDIAALLSYVRSLEHGS